MDSKLKKKMVFMVAVLIIFVFGTVLYTNQKLPGQTQNSAQTVKSETEAAEGELSESDLSAFLEDPNFFDVEVKKKEVIEAVDTNKLMLLASSIEKDLRISVLDDEGRLVAGKNFDVQVLNQNAEGDTYSDLDQDGIIYVEELKAGEYYVSLEDMKGYDVPLVPLKVNVKEQLTYTVIEDISLLIKTEADIDAEQEDTAVKEAGEDDTQMVGRPPSDGKTRFGIDVSKWNKEIDWNKVKEDGVDFAIIRCGYRGSKTGALVEDPYFEQNIKGANEAGIKVGVYFFTQAINEVEAVEEASMVSALCRSYDVAYPVFIDTEGAGGNGRADKLSKEMRTKVCEAFSATVTDAGYTAGVYASKNWYNNNLSTKNLDKYVIWLAEYRGKATYTDKYDIWQYTSKGSVSGINGNVDLNLSYLGY